jgi:NAD(P)-dependent dehydrogenase (short-subunit alcohol dehydrogenase family)
MATALVVAGGLAWLAARRRRPRFDLTGRAVLITGGSRGLGLVLAREFARHGALLALAARDVGALERARDELTARGTRVLALPCDVRDRAQVDALVRRVEEHYGRLDVLVNNAGTIIVGPLEHMTLGDFEDAMATNVWAAVYAVLAALPGMRRRRDGRIVNIASIGGKVSVPHLLPYSASKFALVGFSQGLRAELAKDGVVVTTVCPGLMRTGSPRHALFKGRHRAEYAWFSIGDSSRVSSMSAEAAARRIVTACLRGEAEVVLSPQAKALSVFHGLFPGLTADILGVVNRLLPGPGGIGTATARGRESQSALSPSWLTALGDQAAARNNEVA